MNPALRIVEPGILTTIQDLGRIGYQHLGVATSGALDPVSLRAANALAGNAAEIGTLEVLYAGPTFIVEAESVRLACAGADAHVEVFASETAASGMRVPSMQSFRVHRGEMIRIGVTSRSSVLYVAVEGGFAIEPVLGSVSTFIRGGMGGWQGRPLAAGDRLPLQSNTDSGFPDVRIDDLDLSTQSHFRTVLGPQNSFFSERSVQAFFDHEYTVKPATDRMAMHLAGPKLDHIAGHDIVSDGIAPGSIQVPGHGQPIVLLADRQTTGGYPKLATVISADLAALGRVRIGDKITFEAVTIEEALHLRRKFMEQIESIPSRIMPACRKPDELLTHLMMDNLISGAVDARSPQIAG